MNKEEVLAIPSTGRAATATWTAHLAMLTAIALLACLVARLDRGLELSDEAYYLLYAIHARSISVFFSPFHWVTGPLWELTGSLVAFRGAGMLLSIGAALVLAEGVLHAAKQTGLPVPDSAAGRNAVRATAASGALLYGSMFSLTPSYNLMAAIGTNLATGLCLLAIGADRRRAVLLAVAAGACLALCFLSKVSSGPCVAAVLALLWLLVAEGRLRWYILWAAAAAVATVVAVAEMWGGIAQAINQVRTGVELWGTATGNRSLPDQLLRSAADLGRLLTGGVLAFWGPVACFALALKWFSTQLRWLGLAWFAVLLLTGRHLGGGYERFMLQGQPLFAALLLALLAWAPQWWRDVRRLALVAALIVLPAAVAMGTSNPLEMQVLMALAPWGALVGLAGFAQAQRAAAAVSVLFGLVILAQLIGSGAEPYRTPPLSQQTEPITVPRLGQVRVDPATAALARGFQQGAKACGISAGQPFVDIYNAPGVALLLDLVPVVGPWLNDPEPASLLLARADPAELRRAVVVTTRRSPPGQLPVPPRQLATFPEGYRLCATAASPYDGARMELWAPPS
ncbi:MAG: hypothetical protein V4864_10370 [Pseudomonadota bacterium]